MALENMDESLPTGRAGSGTAVERVGLSVAGGKGGPRDSDTANVSGPRLGGRYLSFALGREEFGLQILKVREIIGIMDLTAVPHAPDHVRGVINLRGQVIAVIDLRTRFGMPPAEKDQQTCIIVTEVETITESDGHPRRVLSGIIVDRVCEVLTIPENDIGEPPHFAGEMDTSFILGIGRVGTAVKILLDIDRVLDTQTVELHAAA